MVNNMNKYLGFGGLGDCFIVILKLLEQPKPYFYTHIGDNLTPKSACEELLKIYNIPSEVIIVRNIPEYFDKYNKNYDKCFNVFAKGYIDIPIRPYHWEPCKDEGFNTSNGPNCSDEHKEHSVSVQVNAGLDDINRSFLVKHVVQEAFQRFDPKSIIWLGTDENFQIDVGCNLIGKTSLEVAMTIVRKSYNFIGFPGFLLYWALYNKVNCYIFPDHQDRSDLRIHSEWKKYITYV